MLWFLMNFRTKYAFFAACSSVMRRFTVTAGLGLPYNYVFPGIARMPTMCIARILGTSTTKTMTYEELPSSKNSKGNGYFHFYY